jgi:hypothetical protein
LDAVAEADDAAVEAALDALEREEDNEPIEGIFWAASERGGKLASAHDVEEGMDPRLKSFAVERGGVASRISE